MNRRTLRCSSLALALFAAGTTTTLARAETLVRAPYLQTLTPSSVIVAWRSDVAAASVVHYGTDPANLGQTATAAGQSTQHEVKITNLTPGTRYYYDVGSGGTPLEGGTSDHSFDTPPPTGTKKKIRAWIVGDSGTGGSAQANVRDAMITYVGRYRPEMYLHMGDMAYNAGTTTEFTDNFFKVYEGIMRHTVVWPTLGNHEGTNSDSGTQSGPYYEAYALPKAAEAGGLPSGTEAYYSFDWGNIHFIVLDSHDSPRDPAGPMMTWMKNDLNATNQDWIIAYWHHPAYTKGSHNSDTETQLVQMRENALPILEAGGVDLVLAGHSHIYERSFLIDGAYATPTTATGHILDSGNGQILGDGPYQKQAGNVAHDGAVYVVAGHGGASVSGPANHPVMAFSELANGSCILDVHENRLALKNIRADGVVSDRFALIKGPGLFIAAPDGGEKLNKGELFDVRWATVGSVPQVKLDYSTDDGASWIPIAGPIVNTGTYTWTVPSVDTDRALVRVSNASNAGMHDESDAGFGIGAVGPTQVVGFGDGWKYKDDGQDLGTAWVDLGYDDSAWPEGPGQLGYGDGDEATVLNKQTPSQPSVYFRKVVTLGNPVLKADLKALFDDGIAVWINGTPVFERNMGNGTAYGAFASQQSQDNEIATGAVDPGVFVAGDNIIAVMVKQASGSSSDTSFDLELVVTPEISSGTGTGTGAGGGSGTGTTGSSGAGGTSGNGGGSSGAGGVGPGSGDESGCGCRAAGDTGASFGWLGLGLALVAMRLRRRPRA